MTPLIDLISSTWSSKRGEYEILPLGGERYGVSQPAERRIVFEGTRDEAIAWIDRQCAEAVAGVIVPAELVALSGRATIGPWHTDVCFSGPTCWCRTVSGPEGKDDMENCVAAAGALRTVNAEFITAAANLVRSLIPATTSETQP